MTPLPINGTLTGEITADTADRLAKWLASASREYANTLTIHSHGGDAIEALASAQAIQASRRPVTAVVVRAESAAATIALACREVRVFSDSVVMLHRSFVDDVHDQSCRDADDLAAQLIARSRGLEPSQVLAWMRADEGRGTSFRGVEIVDVGLADGLWR